MAKVTRFFAQRKMSRKNLTARLRSLEHCWLRRRNFATMSFKSTPRRTRLLASIKSADRWAQVRQHLSYSGFVLPTDAIGVAPIIGLRNILGKPKCFPT
jgi:hypothetical protein